MMDRYLIGAAYVQGGGHARNLASQKVLAKNGFVPAGLSGKPGTWYARDLTAG